VPAKVNLHLAVGPLRADGFHELVTVFHAVDLADELVASSGDGLSLTVAGEGAGELPTDDGNLAWRAAALLAETTGVPPDVHLELRKAIPVAGGMAGGSADAAAALVACSRLWNVDADLPALAAQLGSDVTFALLGGTAVGTGRGEVLSPAPTSGILHWVFALAGFGIAVGDAYGELDRQRAAGIAPAPLGPPDALLDALAHGDMLGIASALASDLQPAALALRPELRATLDTGRAAGALAGLVSGSGPTCAFLCGSDEDAAQVAAALAGACRAVRAAGGPAPGASVVG
jgi:4-diphosphocytidyl-2-C-methyl-D-erythritol kinase